MEKLVRHAVYRSFRNDVTATMLMYQNNGTAAILVSKANPLGPERYFYAITFFGFIEPIWPQISDPESRPK